MSKDYLDKWEERAKKNTEIIEQQQAKTKKMSFKEHEIKRVKELRAKFGDLATEVCNEMLDDRVVPNIGDCESKGLRVHWMLYWENIKSILKQNKDDE